jgi:AcrR family transcriptional regulator
MVERGRPRNFERSDALEKAMDVFWARGYSGASIAELTATMGINSPSLYAAFGSKEALFREAVALYVGTKSACTLKALEGDLSTRDSIAAMLFAAAEGCVTPGKPKGCLIVLGATTGDPETEAMQRYLRDFRRETETRVRKRLERGVNDGELPDDLDLNGIAAYFSTIVNGFSIEARDGASVDTLRRTVDCAMRGWKALTATPG